MWTLNDLHFETVQNLMDFVSSEAFKVYVNQLSPFSIVISSGEGETAVQAELADRKTIWWDQEKLTKADWRITYTTPHGQQDRDPLPVQQTLLQALNGVCDAVNAQLND